MRQSVYLWVKTLD